MNMSLQLFFVCVQKRMGRYVKKKMLFGLAPMMPVPNSKAY